MSDWEDFTNDLARYLENARTDTALIISAPGNRYVQFVLFPDELLAELSAAGHVDAAYRYGSDIEEQLLADGWLPGDKMPNWWHTVPVMPETPDYAETATLAVAGLRAMAVASSADLTAKAWLNYGGGPLDIDPLGIRAAT